MTENKSIASYSPFYAELEQLKADNENLVFQYHTPKGNKDARSHVYTLRKRKNDIERARKAEKADALAFGKRVDTEAKSIMLEYDGMIDIHQAPITELENVETARVEAHTDKIVQINALLESIDELELSAIQGRIDRAATIVVDKSFEEFQEQATTVLTAANEMLATTYAKVKKIDDDRAELAKLKAANEARERAERDAAIAKQAALDATNKAEAKAKEDKEAYQRQVEADQLAKDEAAAKESRRLADERAESDWKAAKLQTDLDKAKKDAKDAEALAISNAAAKIKAEQDEEKARAKNKEHKASINNAAVDGLIAGGMTKDNAIKAVTLIAQRKVPNVKISY